MRKLIRQIIERAPFNQLTSPLRSDRARQRREGEEISEWKRKGSPPPPPHIIKERNIRRYAKQYGANVLVETGTYLGEMVEKMKPYFDKIYSIELHQELFARAQERFASDAHIELIQGDSRLELKKVMEQLDRPAVFWLDGHYSGGITAKGDKETPILDELSNIFAAPDLGHVILIDDARLFGTDPAYPTLGGIKELVGSARSSAKIVVEDDSIVITP